MGSKVPSDPNLTPEMRVFLEDTSRAEQRLTQYIDDQIDANALALASQAEAEAGTDNAKYMSSLRVAQAIDAQTVVPIFTKSYVSPAQTITAGGSLTLAHGLGSRPLLVQVELVNVSTELNYTAGDVVFIHPSSDANSNVGFALVPDATNLNVQYGSAATSLTILNKTTGATALITNAKWNAVFRAWA